VYDDVTYVYDDVTYVYDDVTYVQVLDASFMRERERYTGTHREKERQG